MGFYIVRSSGTEQVIVAVGSILWAYFLNGLKTRFSKDIVTTELSTIIATNASNP